MQGKLQKLFFIVPLFFLSTTVYAGDNNNSNISKFLFDTFNNKGFLTEYQGLAPSDPAKFPQNLIINILPAANGEEEAPPRNLETVIFAFTQEYAAADIEGFTAFAEQLAGLQLPYTLQILLSANDVNRRLPRDELSIHPTGAAVFASAISTASDTSCALVLEEAEGSTHAIHPGGAGDIAPLWLVRTVKNACNSHGLKSQLPNSAAFLYRLGFVYGSGRVSVFLAQSIPAVGLTIGHTAEDYAVMRTIAAELAEIDSNVWDRHYSYVHIPFVELEFWLNETYFAFCYLLLAGNILFLLCFTTFSRNQKNVAILKDMARVWYLIPLLVLFTTLMLQATQLFFVSVVRRSTLLLGYKLIAAFMATLLLFVFQQLLNFKVSYQANNFTLLAVCASNIFTFCAIDLSFLFLFFAEYLICYLTKNFKKTLALIGIFLLMLLPFLPAATNIMLTSGPFSLRKFANTSLAGNFFTSCVIFPFQLQFQRILMSMDISSKQSRHSLFRRFAYGMIFVAISISAFAAFYFVFANRLLASSMENFRAIFPTTPTRRMPFEENESHEYITIAQEEERFMEFKLHHVMINCEDGVKILRYNISIEAQTEVPLYDCNYNYTISGENKVYLQLPDYPDGDLAIVYSSEQEQTQTISIDTYLQTAEGKLILEHDTVQSSQSKGSR